MSSRQHVMGFSYRLSKGTAAQAEWAARVAEVGKANGVDLTIPLSDDANRAVMCVYLQEDYPVELAAAEMKHGVTIAEAKAALEQQWEYDRLQPGYIEITDEDIPL
jgi:hypothetical protein